MSGQRQPTIGASRVAAVAGLVCTVAALATGLAAGLLHAHDTVVQTEDEKLVMALIAMHTCSALVRPTHGQTGLVAEQVGGRTDPASKSYTVSLPPCRFPGPLFVC